MIKQIPLTFVFILSIFSNVYAQDTTSIYFETSSSKIKPFYEQALKRFAAELNKEEIEFIYIIGFSDSIGRQRGNMKLSEKRAKAVQKLCFTAFNDSTQYIVGANGEHLQIADSSGRRVDIIVHYKLQDDDESSSAEIDSIKPNDPRCFTIDTYIMRFCHVDYITKSKKEYAYIQAVDIPLLHTTKYYYVKNPGKPDAVAQRVKWKLTTTGKLWWKQKRMIATIPKEGFDQFQLFMIEPAPCKGCKEGLFKKDSTVVTGKTRVTDVFLSQNIQVKGRLFKRKTEQVRVPAEYVDLAEDYYAELYRNSSYKSHSKLEWEKKRSKRKEDYLYTEIRTGDATSFTISKKGYYTYCPVTDSARYAPYKDMYTGMWGCGGLRGGFNNPFYLGPEIGAFYHNDTVTGFLGLALSYTQKKQLLTGVVGINTHLGLYASLRYRVEFAEFEILKVNGIKTWVSPAYKSVTALCRVYAGTELRTSYTKSYRSFTEANLHVGVCYAKGSSGFEYELYLHGGVAKDLSNRINKNPYPYVQLGLTFKL